MSLPLTLALCQIFIQANTVGSAWSSDPESLVRMLVQANADRSLDRMSRFFAHDAQTIGYTIGGRRYAGWEQLARDLQHEFDSVVKLEIPIKELQVWRRGDVAWFAMELDYIRYLKSAPQVRRTVLPLRETGVLEHRNGEWLLVGWHESEAGPIRMASGGGAGEPPPPPAESKAMPPANHVPDLSGQWEIAEEDKSYVATLDSTGNGSYTWQGGKITTSQFTDRRWLGTWQQTGNDREGGFEVLLSEDGTEAKGVWWYTRVGDKNNIPPRQWGGPYTWKRLAPVKPQP